MKENRFDFVFDDGGRGNHFKSKKVGDCVTRAVALATEIEYKIVYDFFSRFNEKNGHTKSARNGVGWYGEGKKSKFRITMNELGFDWIPLMKCGQGCTHHLLRNELESFGNNFIAKVSGHLVAVVDLKIHDTYDCSREGTRCVYGVYKKNDNWNRQDTETFMLNY